jgi:hypothetical protein
MPAAQPYPDRLDWLLPDFMRIAWVSDGARVAWEPRIARLRSALKEAEQRSVLAGVRRCAAWSPGDDDLARERACFAKHGLSLERLARPERTAHKAVRGGRRAGGRDGDCAVIGRAGDVAAFAAAWAAWDDDAVGALLGYAPCCRSFFVDHVVGQGCADTTWPMALAGREPASRTIEIAAERPANNILWRWLGIRAVPHFPCGFCCSESERLAGELRAVAEGMGMDEELGWLDEILSWPVEWSALHGIAEIKTPILKITTRTDATASKYAVRWLGPSYPVEGARGLGFPYRTRVPS